MGPEFKSHAFPLRIREQTFWLTADRVVFWEEERVLFASDLHWGREAFLQRKGFAVPDVLFASDSEILSRVIEESGAKEFWILGDFAHHPEGMHDGLKARIAKWRSTLKKTEVILVPGNHDRSLTKWLPECGISLHREPVKRGTFRFLHEPEVSPEADFTSENESLFSWYGHLHPALKIPELTGSRKYPAYYVRESCAYLPALSRLAGGAEVSATLASDRLFPIAEGEVFEWSNRKAPAQRP